MQEMCDLWVGKTPWSRKWQPTPVFLPGKFHGQRSLAGYSLWDHRELDTTWQLNNNNNKHVRIPIPGSCSYVLPYMEKWTLQIWGVSKWA